MFTSGKRQHKSPRRPSWQPLLLEALEERTLLSNLPTTILDPNSLTIAGNQVISTDILVQFQGAPGTQGAPAIVPGTTLDPQGALEPGWYVVDLGPSITVPEALADYKGETGVLDDEPDFVMSTDSVPNDPFFGQQWDLNNTGQDRGTPGADISALNAWTVTTGNRNIIVAVVDTGVDFNNPDLAENIWINQAAIPANWLTKSSATSGYDTTVFKSQIKTATPGLITMADLNNPANAGLVWKSDGNSLVDGGDLLRGTGAGGWTNAQNRNNLIGTNTVDTMVVDGNGHGTHVAGIIGASGDNGIGVAGIDWNVQIMPVKSLSDAGSGSTVSVVQGINYAVTHGANIINMSLGGGYNQVMNDACQNAQQHGVICVCAAGNDNRDAARYSPGSASAEFDNVVTVAATDRNDKKAPFSNYGVNTVALAAPGVQITSTWINKGLGGTSTAAPEVVAINTISGTSMAAPEVAGALALVWGLHPSWSYKEVVNQVLDTADKLPNLAGFVKNGARLNLAAAVGFDPNASFNMVVNTTADATTADSTLSLREAINLANGTLSLGELSAAERAQVTIVAGNVDTITFASSLNGSTLTLSTVGDSRVGPSAFLVNSLIVINGNSGITLSAAGTTMRLFDVTSAGKLTLQNLTLRGGNARGLAGGNARFGGAGGASAGLGGAIFNQGTLTILDSTLTGNTAQGGAGGSFQYGLPGLGGAGGAGLDTHGEAERSNLGSNGGGPNGGAGNGGGGGFGGGGGGGNGSNIVGGTGGLGGFGGGGGGGGYLFSRGGGGGFGGGGGGGVIYAGGAGGYAAGSGGGGSNGQTGGGGGGAGLGGAIFNEAGIVIITNSTFTGNSAIGGSGGMGRFGAKNGTAGKGLGTGLFNHNGTITVTNSTLSAIAADQGGHGIFNLEDSGFNTTASTSATVTYSILGQAGAGSGSDLAQAGFFSGSATVSGGSNLISQMIFLTSAEFVTRSGGTPEQYVDALYQTLLDRSSSGDDGAHSFVSLIQDGAASAISSGQEGNQTLASQLNASVLERNADTDGLSFWTSSLQETSGAAEEALASFLASDEFFSRA